MKKDNNDKVRLLYVSWNVKKETEQEFLDRLEAFGIEGGDWKMKSYHRKWYVRAWRQFKFWLSKVW